MAILTTGTKDVLINSAADFPVVFTTENASTGVNETAASPAAADRMTIRTFTSSAKPALIGSVHAERAQAAVKHRLTVDAAQAGQITVASVPVGTPIHIQIKVNELSFKGEHHRSNSRFGRNIWLTVHTSVANESAASILQKIHTSISGRQDLFAEASSVESDAFLISSSFAGGVLTLEALDAQKEFVIELTDEVRFDSPSSAVPVFAPVIAARAYEGRGTYENMLPLRLQTSVTMEPYHSQQQLELPVRGAKYTAISWEQVIDRPDLGGGDVADAQVRQRSRFTIWVKEGADNEAYIQDIVNFLTSAPASVTKAYATKSANAATKAEFIAN